MPSPDLAAAPPASKALHIALWVAQALLAAAFFMAGGLKLLGPEEGLPVPVLLARFIGAAEIAGSIGLIAPALSRIKPVLTPIAAGCLALVMVLATGFHLSRGEPPAPTALLGALALFVAWGRGWKARIAAA